MDFNKKKSLYAKYFMAFIVLSLFITLVSCKSRESLAVKDLDTYVANRDFDKALEASEELIAMYPKNPFILRNKAIALMGKKDYGKAVEVFDEAIKLNKKNLKSLENDIIYYKATALFKQGMKEQAYDEISKISDKSKSKATYLLQGIIALELGRKQEAITAFDEVISKNRKDYDIYIELFNAMDAYNYTQSGKDYLLKGIEAAKKSKNNFYLGKLYYFNKNYEMAVKTLENERKNKAAQIYLSKALYMQDEKNKAFEISDASIKNGDKFGEHYNITALYYMSLEDYQKALDIIDEALASDNLNNISELMYNKAVAYEYLGEFEAAKSIMKELTEKYPDLEAAKREFLFLKTR